MERRRSRPAVITDIIIDKPGINIIYPKIEGLKHKSVEKKINSIVKNEVYKLLKVQGYEYDKSKKYNGIYTVKLNLRGIISLILENTAIAENESSGITIRKVINISLKDARIYKLNDLFNRRKDYIGGVNDEIRHQLLDKKIEFSSQFKGIDRETCFYLTEEKIVIYFNAGEFTPINIGFPEFEINHEDIEEFIHPKGPITKLLYELRNKE